MEPKRQPKQVPEFQDVLDVLSAFTMILVQRLQLTDPATA
ncbi:hypothetical protein PQBR44_0012 (plasmid) [Pseudomonas putida UWC1]|jgi:hypothetical protein|nr:hypothetical protein PQBR44_0012 [Pseudomonas putida UWC1]